MQPLSALETETLRHLLGTQPTTPAKVAFAWRMAAGPAFGRATEAMWRADGVLLVRPRGDAWRREVRAARPMLLKRLQDLLGSEVVARLEIE